MEDDRNELVVVFVEFSELNMNLFMFSILSVELTTDEGDRLIGDETDIIGCCGRLKGF